MVKKLSIHMESVSGDWHPYSVSAHKIAAILIFLLSCTQHTEQLLSQHRQSTSDSEVPEATNTPPPRLWAL